MVCPFPEAINFGLGAPCVFPPAPQVLAMAVTLDEIPATGSTREFLKSLFYIFGSSVPFTYLLVLLKKKIAGKMSVVADVIKLQKKRRESGKTANKFFAPEFEPL